jgi:hypothetical protein
MPPAFALSQDQTLRFIQASPCNQSHTATPKRTSKGSSLSPNTSQPPKITKHQAKTPKTDIPKEHPPRRRPRIPPRHSSQQGKNTQQQSSAQSYPKDSQALSTSKKTRCNCQTTKKEPATEHLTAFLLAGPLNSTNHRQGKNTSQYKPASQAQKHHNP